MNSKVVGFNGNEVDEASTRALNALYLANFISMLGTSMLFIFNIWLSYTISGSGVEFAVLIAVATLPSILLGTQIGAFTDRFDAKVLMTISESSRVLFLILMLTLINTVGTLTLFIGTFIFLMSISERLFKITQRKCLRKLASDEHLTKASAALSISTQVGAIVGGALGGMLTAANPNLVLLISMGTFLLSGSLLFYILKSPGDSQTPSDVAIGFKSSIFQTMPLILENPQAIFWYSFNTVIVVCIQVINLLVFPFIAEYLKGDPKALGFIEASIALGSIIGSSLIIKASKRQVNELSMMKLALIVLSCSLIVFSFNRSLEVACLIYFMVGIALSSFALFSAAAQRSVRYENQGRIHATFASITGFSSMLFAIISGVFMDLMPAALIYQIFGGLLFVLSIYFIFNCKRFRTC